MAMGKSCSDCYSVLFVLFRTWGVLVYILIFINSREDAIWFYLSLNYVVTSDASSGDLDPYP